MIKKQPFCKIKTTTSRLVVIGSIQYLKLILCMLCVFECVKEKKKENGFIHVSSSLVGCAKGLPSLH